MNRCPNCGLSKPLSEFHTDKTKASGYKSWCKTCENKKRKRNYDPQRSRERYLTQLEESGKTPRSAQPRQGRSHNNRHGGPDEWARLFKEQDGLCYLCLRPLPENRSKVHVDHDHSCCNPGFKGHQTDSCQYCRRGLAHEKCNQIWGLAAEDPEVLRAIASQGERVAVATRARITAKPSQGELLLA